MEVEKLTCFSSATFLTSNGMEAFPPDAVSTVICPEPFDIGSTSPSETFTNPSGSVVTLTLRV